MEVLSSLDPAMLAQLSGQVEVGNPEEMMQRLMEIPELAAALGGARQSAEQAASIARHLIDVGLAEPMLHAHVHLHPAVAPYLSSELSGTARQSATAA